MSRISVDRYSCASCILFEIFKLINKWKVFAKVCKHISKIVLLIRKLLEILVWAILKHTLTHFRVKANLPWNMWHECETMKLLCICIFLIMTKQKQAQVTGWPLNLELGKNRGIPSLSQKSGKSQREIWSNS